MSARTRIRTLLVSTAALLAGAVPCAHAAGLSILSHHGRWLTDPLGRVVILHGLQIDHADAFGVERSDLPAQSVAFLGAEGFNLARVSISLAGYLPAPNTYARGYLTPYLALDRELARAGVYDLVDMMQGQYSFQFDGGGFPDWMAKTDGFPNQPGPFPQSYLYDPAEERAWDNFWANAAGPGGAGLEDDYAAALQRIAATYDHAPGYLGTDLMNEPWPGSQYGSCANPKGCPLFDAELNAFYRRIIPALRRGDPDHPAFYEPHALFDQGAATNVGAIGDPNAVFTFHNYCLGDQPGLPQSDPGQNCGVNEQIVLGNAEAQASIAHDALLEDEWGNTASLPLLQRMAAEADQHMIGWSYWAYEDCCNSPGAIVYHGTKLPTQAGNLNLPVLKALVRPYPKAIAGTPQAWTYDPLSDVFTLSYTTRGVDGRAFGATAETDVEIPALRYPTGYTVTVTGAHAVSAPDANLLRLRNNTGAATVTLTVRPARHHPGGPGPFSWPAAASADAIAPADCPAQTSELRVLRTPPRARVVSVLVYVDGHRVLSFRARRIARVSLPAGLADGSMVRLVANTASGRSFTQRLELHHCV